MVPCGTTITYNGITINDVLTHIVNNDVVRDSTGVDPVGIRTTIECEAVLHTTDAPHGLNVSWSVPGEGLAAGIAEMVRRLSLPRRRFVMQNGNDTWYDIVPSEKEPGTCNPTQMFPNDVLRNDIEFGPSCNVSVVSVSGTRSARCKFRFVFTTAICGNASDISNVLNLRYWTADDIDCRSFLTTRVWNGVFRVKRKGSGAPAVNPHILARTLTLPPIQRGFRRERIAWSESPNGLEFHFSITDKEQWAQAPSPATHWEGTFSMSVPTGDILCESELTFRLWGDKNTDKRELFRLAQRIVDAKLEFKKYLPSGDIIVISQVWQEKLEANEVTCHMRVRNTGPDRFYTNLAPTGSLFNLGLPLPEEVGDPQPYDKEVAYAPNLPTATLAGLFVCSLQTPCCAHDINERQLTPTTSTVTYPQTQVVRVEYKPPTKDDVLSDQVPKNITGHPSVAQLYSTEHNDRSYQWYRITSRYVGDTGWRGFAKGSQCTDNSSDTMAFAQIHCPISCRKIVIHACRADKWPDVPKLIHWKDKNGVKYVLKDWEYEPNPVTITADGRHRLHEIYMTLYYYMSRKPNVATDSASLESFAVGCIPYINKGALSISEEGADPTQVRQNSFVDPKNILNQTD